MALELDHLFICTEFGASEAARLIAFGLTEGASNTHPGQGTACRRFFFHNAYLELLWIHDAIEAQSELIRPTRLLERWAGRSSGACPFGLCFRPAANHVGDLSFSAWDYHPPYLPESMSIAVAANADFLTEPMLFSLAFARRPNAYPADKRQPLEHIAGLREITRVEVIRPDASRVSPVWQAVIEAGLLRHHAGTEYLAELGFDGELRGQAADFRPVLPLAIRW